MSVFAVGATGGSGAAYTVRLLEALLDLGHEVKLVMSPAGERVFEIEMGLAPSGNKQERQGRWEALLNTQGRMGNLELLDQTDYAASIASGTFPTEGMVIAPCSMGTLARIAGGISSNLIERAADVMIKERRKLILVPREAPYSLIHIKNMLTVTEAGGEILPASPGFYHNPTSIDDLINFIAGRILNRLGLPNTISQGWTGAPSEN